MNKNNKVLHKEAYYRQGLGVIFGLILLWGIDFGIQLYWRVYHLNIVHDHLKQAIIRALKFELLWLGVVAGGLGVVAFVLHFLPFKWKWVIPLIGSFIGVGHFLTSAYYAFNGDMLGGVVYSMDFNTLKTILTNSISNLQLFCISVWCIAIFWWIHFCAKAMISKTSGWWAFLVLGALGLFAWKNEEKLINSFYNELWIDDHEIDLSHDKLFFLLYQLRIEQKRASFFEGKESVDYIADFEKSYPNINFADKNYPYLHESTFNPTITPFFKSYEAHPNIVIIFSESLSRAFSGKNAYYGSYTPFLDSLAQQSLYWENFLSNTDLTYGLLPSVLASAPDVPHKRRGFINLDTLPTHQNVLSILQKNGYDIRAYGAMDFGYDKMGRFLENAGAKVHNFSQFAKKGNTWGPSDLSLYRLAAKEWNTSEKPRVDLYFPMSLHTPFTLDSASHYLKLVDSVPKKISEYPYDKNRRMLASFLYTDDPIRQLIATYQKNPIFENTIFLIMGDHEIHDVNHERMGNLHKYHVPLIIYSPLLKNGQSFKGINTHRSLAPAILEMAKVSTPNPTHWWSDGLDTTQNVSSQYGTMLGSIYNKSPKDLRYIKGNVFWMVKKLFK